MTADTIKKLSILFTCLLIAPAYGEGRCPTYKVDWVKGVVLNSADTKILIDAEIIIQQLEGNQKIEKSDCIEYYISTLYKMHTVINGSSEMIQLHDCSSFQKASQELSEPFHVCYKNGLFHSLRVPKDSENLSVNLKLIFSQALQYEITKLVQITSRSNWQTTQMTPFGSCDVFYEAMKGTSDGKEVYKINKNFNMNSCSEINKPINSFENVCNRMTEQNTRFDNSESSIVFANSSMIPFKAWSSYESTLFNPWKGSQEKIKHYFRESINFKSFKNNCKMLSTLTSENSDVVTALRYIKPVSFLIDINSSDPLKKSYSALACGDFHSNTFAELYKLAMQCKP